ncbi:MAG: PQQ-dependent sugar dehydrogenase, partial [Pirellulales bacterium]
MSRPSLADAGATSGAGQFDIKRFEKEILVHAALDPLQMEVLPDGRVLFIELGGLLKLFRPGASEVKVVGRIPAAVYSEVGLLGLALDRNFSENSLIYLFYCPQEKKDTLRLSRYLLRDDGIDLASEKIVLDYPIDPSGAQHMGGGLWMDPRGLLHIGTGDNCPPIPELPVDQRPGKRDFDALRSSGNSNDLRGSVLRIRPEPDGTYTIPEGNLFPDGKDGRAEIYTMGVRNAFRLSVDPKNGWVYWGDVGPNIALALKIGPNGYDEVNQARRAGNFGYPMFTGPNEAYRMFDFETRTVGEWFDIQNPFNPSRRNTGLKKLPSPQPAFIWYPTTVSKVFPVLGSGGRSAMVGPVFYADLFVVPPLGGPHDEATHEIKEDRLKAELQTGLPYINLRLPEYYDRTLFIYEWTRNWIMAVRLNDDGDLERIEPFLPHMIFRKPIDMKLAADGTLYVIEYGDKWGGNQDAKIVRIVYRRGNRHPVAVAHADKTSGKQPLKVRFDATRSHDRDVSDRLQYDWQIQRLPEPRGEQNSGPSPILFESSEGQTDYTFNEPGNFRAVLTVTDPQGAQDRSTTTIQVGNAPPQVTFTEPAQGSFVDWDDPVMYRVRVDDEEDGSTEDGRIDPRRVVVRARYQSRRRSAQPNRAGRPFANDDALLEPGLALMRRTTCFSCHTTLSASAGPPYSAVAIKYHDKPEARQQLAEKIITGGAGVWGEKPMPPHPQHTLEETRQMVAWIMTLATESERAPVFGTEGVFMTKHPGDQRAGGGVYLVTAGFSDNPVGALPAQTSEAILVLNVRRRQAAKFDRRSSGVKVVDEFEQGQWVVRLRPEEFVAFEDVNLVGIDRITLRGMVIGDGEAVLEVRRNTPTGET